MDKKFETKKMKSLSTFAKEHKKEITISALTIVTIVTVIVIHKKFNVPLGAETVKECIPNLLLDTEIDKNCDADNNSASKTINVQEYIRKLPKNYKHSQNAVELAEKLGYTLRDDETFVKPYSYLKTSA